MKPLAFFFLALLFLLPPDADARSAAAVSAFKKHAPCPATGQTRGKCPGWQVDHIVPLCAGGADTPANMQWLTVERHKQKTKADVRNCRMNRKA